MGEWGPTATNGSLSHSGLQCSRWGNGGQPQRSRAFTIKARQCSRWGNGGQLQLAQPAVLSGESVADGGMGANRN